MFEEELFENCLKSYKQRLMINGEELSQKRNIE